MPSAIREDYSAGELRKLARRSKDVNQSRRLLSLAGFETEWTEGRPRGSAAWTGGRFTTAFTASTPRVRRGFLITGWKARSLALSEEQMARLRRSSRLARARERRRRALAARRSPARHRRAVRRRLPRALCRCASEEDRPPVGSSLRRKLLICTSTTLV
jgi:hypothetical protein